MTRERPPGRWILTPSVRCPLLVCMLLACPLHCHPQDVPARWRSDLLRESAHWIYDENDPSIGVSEQGLQVSIPTGSTWRIAAANRILLPQHTGKIRLHVAELGGSGQWFMRIYGDLRGDGHARTVGFFQDETRTGVVSLAIDRRLIPQQQPPPLQVQLGVEGAPGDYAVFQSLEFLPGEDQSERSHMTAQPGQRPIDCVALMPRTPQPFKMLDWRARARDYDDFVFDFEANGQYLPLIWIDDSRVNFDQLAFGLPSYVGDPHRASGPHHESITCMGAALGASLVGIDKRSQQHDYVRMCQAYYTVANGERLLLNGIHAQTGGSFWYEIWPHIVFYALADRYPETESKDAIVKDTANRWRDACLAMRDDQGRPDFDHTAFRFRTMEPVDNGRWKEPDAAAGIGWIQYMAWTKHQTAENLEAADLCMQFLDNRQRNPYYEVLLPYGTLVAARMNAELGRDYDVHKLLNWCFGLSDCRGGWGVIASTWHGYDCHGLLGSVDNRGGYAFAMNTFAQAGALVPLVRYDDRYAQAIGRWMLNLANAARLFYPGKLPPGHESCPAWQGDPQGVIAYEGLRHQWQGKGPFATGDPVVMKWGPATNRGLYGSGYVGLLGSIIGRTSDEKILQLDCLATDFYRSAAYPTYLLYNPHEKARDVTIDVGRTPCDVYDACTDTFLHRNVRNQATIAIPADHAVLIVLPPTGGTESRQADKTLINGIVIDYRRTTD